MHKIDVGIVGCGFVANDHLRAWRKVSQARVVAVCDLNETMAKSTAKRWKIPHYHVSFSKLMKHKNIDLVDICTPPQTHASLAVQGMKNGCSVLLEKPMTMTVRDAKEIVKCQKITGMKAGVIHNWLFEPPVLEADSLIKKGYLGEVISVDVEALSTKDDSMAANAQHWCHSLPGGRFSEMLAHPIYLIKHFLGEFDVVNVQVSKIGEYAWMKSDELYVTSEAGKKLGRTYASFNASRDDIFITLYGREAILKLDIKNATTIVLPRREISRFSKGFDSLRQVTQLLKSTVANMAKITFRSWSSGHEMYIKLFAQSLINDSKPPVTVEDGYEAVKVLERICERIRKAEKEKPQT